MTASQKPGAGALDDASDMRPRGWVARLPAAWQPYALLARLDRPVGIVLLFLPGAWGILLPPSPWAAKLRLLVLFAVGSVVMRGAGCVVNDMWDRDLDAAVRRTTARPLAAGTLRLRHAALFLCALLCLGLAVLLQLDRTAQVIGAGSLLLVAVYPLAKRVTWWPQLVMGFTFGVGAPVGYAAAGGRIDAAMLALYAAAIAWDLGFDTIYGFQDMEDDAAIGVKSTSRRFAHAPRAFVGCAYVATIALLAAAGAAARLSWRFDLALLAPACLLALQVQALDIGAPRTCLALFRLNRPTGLLIAGAILIGRL